VCNLYTHLHRLLIFAYSHKSVSKSARSHREAAAKTVVFVLGLRLRDIGVRMCNLRICAGVSKTVRPSVVDVDGLVREIRSRCLGKEVKDARKV